MDVNLKNCKKCLLPYKPELLSKGRCEECIKLTDIQAKQAMKASDGRAVGKAAYEFLSHLKKAKDKTVVGPEIFDSLLEKLGGKEGFVDKLLEDFQSVRGPDGVASANVKYWALFNDLRKERDAEAMVDVSGMTDEDLIAVIAPVAEKMIKSDKELRISILKSLMSEDPEFKREVMELGGAVVFDVESNKPNISAPQFLDYEEAGDGDEE